MKVEFELTIDNDGLPCIQFRHYDQDNSLEQKTLNAFINAVKTKGCKLVNINGHLCSSRNESWENYEIQINK